MKKFQKITALVIALVMIMALAITSNAASNGKITVNNATVGQTYSVYEILTLESYNKTAGIYSYKAAPGWEAFVTAQTGTYFTVDTDGYVTWKNGVLETEAANLAKAAKTYAAGKTALASTKATATTVVFSGLDEGYYLVESTLGTICSLDTTNNEVVINDKNTEPTIEKEVKEGTAWGDTSYAEIGETVNFKTTVSAKKGALNYVIHDKMTDGLTLTVDSIAIAGLTKGTDYTVVTDGLTDDCDFEIVFAQTYLDTITADTDIVLTYDAVLNTDAAISTESNDNETKLTYGDKASTTWDKTETYTFKFDLVKTNESKEVITGATFKLYDAEEGGSEIKVVKLSDGLYRVAVEGEDGVVIEAGQATVQGLDGNKTYYLEEIDSPEGYNKLSGRQAVAIETANLEATVDTTGETPVYTAGGVQIINKTGSLFPSTGGIGTTVFYVVGGLLVVAAVVFLVSKRRMKNDKQA